MFSVWSLVLILENTNAKYHLIWGQRAVALGIAQYIRRGLKYITINNKEYPEKLKNIYNPPKGLYAIGNLDLLNLPSVAIIGSRNCSRYGEMVAKKFGQDIAKKGIAVVSGMARGIDTFAHIGCLLGNGKTIAVLGSGLNNIYPKENEKLFHRIIEKGGVIISEYQPQEKPISEHFPARNRIISGLCDKLIVVEAAKRSGTFITVDFALEQGKEIYAVPGNITSYKSERNQ